MRSVGLTIRFFPNDVSITDAEHGEHDDDHDEQRPPAGQVHVPDTDVAQQHRAQHERQHVYHQAGRAVQRRPRRSRPRGSRRSRCRYRTFTPAPPRPAGVILFVKLLASCVTTGTAERERREHRARQRQCGGRKGREAGDRRANTSQIASAWRAAVSVWWNSPNCGSSRLIANSRPTSITMVRTCMRASGSRCTCSTPTASAAGVAELVEQPWCSCCRYELAGRRRQRERLHQRQRRDDRGSRPIVATAASTARFGPDDECGRRQELRDITARAGGRRRRRAPLPKSINHG